jgi:hypothetical protein
MDADECKHVVLGLIFLECISNAFEERYRQLQAEAAFALEPTRGSLCVPRRQYPPGNRTRVLCVNRNTVHFVG